EDRPDAADAVGVVRPVQPRLGHALVVQLRHPLLRRFPHPFPAPDLDGVLGAVLAHAGGRPAGSRAEHSVAFWAEAPPFSATRSVAVAPSLAGRRTGSTSAGRSGHTRGSARR